MPNRLHAVLASVALVAWALFILACTGASWSPDGTKILFSFTDPESRQTGIAYYDLNTGTTSTLFLRASDKAGGAYSYAQWQRDGTRALIFTMPVDSSNLTVMAMPVGSSGTARQFSLPGVDEAQPSLPYPEINGQLFVDGQYLARLNLETGQVKISESKNKEAKFLFSDGARLFFARQGGKGILLIGEVAQETLQRRVLARLDINSVTNAGVDVTELFPVPALEPHSGLMAFIGVGVNKDAIVLCSRQGFERAFWPDLPLDSYVLTGLHWSADGRDIYASALSNRGDKTVLYLAEIPADGSRGRVTEVVRYDQVSFLYSYRGMLQVPLSPDGHTIALSLADFGKDIPGEKARALFLVKLNDPDRKVTAIPAPRAEYPPSALPDEPEEKPMPPPPPSPDRTQ